MILRPILVRPRHDGNVGAVVRVAANFGVAEVVLVDEECDIEGRDLKKMAMGAEALVRLRRAASLDEAVADADVVVATTSGRERDSRHLLAPDEVASRLREAGAASAALVFGGERGGLRQEELRRSHMLLTIPANPAFPTLNLVQAVAIVLAALSRGALDPPHAGDPLDAPAPDADFDAAMEHMKRALLETSFLDRVNPARVASQLRRLLGRAVPTAREVAIVRALAAHIEWLWRRSGRPAPP